MIEMCGEDHILVGKLRITAAQDTDNVGTRDRLVVRLTRQRYLGSEWGRQWCTSVRGIECLLEGNRRTFKKFMRRRNVQYSAAL
jgi:hypothetical protein